MVSTAGRDIMKSEVRGLILAFISRQKGTNRETSHVQDPVELLHSEINREEATRAMRSLHTDSDTETSEVKLEYSRVSLGFLTYSQKGRSQVE